MMRKKIFISHSSKDNEMVEDYQPWQSLPAEPLEELLLELSDPGFQVKKGTRRARAKAKLTYVPARQKPGESVREVQSQERFQFTAPLGPIENEDLTWYLERYFLWPTGVFKQRARRIEQKLPEWGKALYEAVLHDESARQVLAAWQKTTNDGKRRFTVLVDSRLDRGSKKKKQVEADEAAALLLGLPWELLHDDRGYLFQGPPRYRCAGACPTVINWREWYPSRPSASCW